jgi:hypothetical protein
MFAMQQLAPRLWSDSSGLSVLETPMEDGRTIKGVNMVWQHPTWKAVGKWTIGYFPLFHCNKSNKG